MAELERLLQLRVSGALTKKEYKRAKELLLGPQFPAVPETGPPTIVAVPDDGTVVGPPLSVPDFERALQGPLDLHYADDLGSICGYAEGMPFISGGVDMGLYEKYVGPGSPYRAEGTWYLEWYGPSEPRRLIELPYWSGAISATSAVDDILAVLPREAAAFTKVGQASQILDAMFGDNATDRGPRNTPMLSKALRRLRKALPSPTISGEFRRMLAPYFEQHDYPAATIRFSSEDRSLEVDISASGFLATSSPEAVKAVIECSDQGNPYFGCLCPDVHLSTYYCEAWGLIELWAEYGPPRVEYDSDLLTHWLAEYRPNLYDE